MKSYLIIGASGFIGSNIINCLSQKSRILIITTNKDKIQKIIKKKFINLRIENYNFLNKKNLKKIQSYKTIINCAGVYFKGNNLTEAKEDAIKSKNLGLEIDDYIQKIEIELS